jgi:hypothetical protein
MDSGFVAGTLVHTDKGLVPIEQIKVGDLVLSKPENGEGELAYKSVVNVSNIADAIILGVQYANILNPMPNLQMKVLYCSIGQLVWVVKDEDENSVNKWIAQEPEGWGSKVPYLDGALAKIQYVSQVLEAQNSNVGFAYDCMNDLLELLVDFSGNQIKTYCLDDDASWRGFYSEEVLLADYDSNIIKEFLSFFGTQGRPNVFRAKCYNLDVADFHTYFVDEFGIWVHS